MTNSQQQRHWASNICRAANRVVPALAAALVLAIPTTLPAHVITPTSTSLGSAANPAAFGQPVTFTATVSSASGTPTGKVTFMNGSEILHTATLAGSVASYVTAKLPVGTASITAAYAGNAKFAGSTSAALAQEVTQAPSAVTLSSSANPALVGQPVTFTATVTAPFRGIPTGEAVLSTANTALGVGSLTGGVASVTTSSLAQGITAITATYLPAANFSGSSATLAQTVQSAGPQSYTLAASPLNPGSTTAGNASASSLILTPVRSQSVNRAPRRSATSNRAPRNCSLPPPSPA